MKQISFLIFVFAFLSSFAQDVDIIILDFENTESNDFDKRFYENSQSQKLIEFINNSDETILILVEKELSHIRTSRDESIELINNLTNPEYGFQAITNIPFWEKQLENIIDNNYLRDILLSSVASETKINITFITNSSELSTVDRIKDFYKELGLVFDLYNSSGFIENLNSTLYVSYSRDSQKILNLHDEI